MKKILALTLALVMSLSLAACSSSDSTTTETATTESTTTETATTETAEKTYKIAMICDSSINDGGWGAACYTAMVNAAETLGWEHQYTDSIAQSDYVDSMLSYCDLGYDMIFLPGNQYTDATIQVAADYPDTCFTLLNGAEDVPTDNITSLLPNADQIGYLAGAMAGLMTESNVLGFIGGMEIDTTKAKLAGMEAGAQAINPDITVLSAYAGSYSDTAKGMELANGMISEGADVFFGDASSVDSGARQAIDQVNDANGEIAIYDIGQPGDILGQNPCVITSVVTDNSGMLRVAMEAMMAGTFGNEVVYGTLENGCLSVGAISEDLVSADVQEAFYALVDEIAAGTFPG